MISLGKIKSQTKNRIEFLYLIWLKVSSKHLYHMVFNVFGEALLCTSNFCHGLSHLRKTHAINSQFSSVQFSHSIVSDPLQPHESQHARPPCPSPSPGVHSHSRPSSPWCHPAIPSSAIPFSSCPQSLPASKSFPMSQLFSWGGQSTGVSALAPFLPKKSQGWGGPKMAEE